MPERDRHELLKSDRRRLVLDVLADAGSSLRLDELARRVATRGDGTDVTDARAVRGLETSLHHHHLIKMDALSIVRYDAEEGRVAG